MKPALSPYKESADLDRMRQFSILDVHAHLGDFNFFSIPCNSPDEMVGIMDEIGIAAVCVSSLVALGPDSERGNDMVMRFADSHPGRILGYAVVNPHVPGFVKELDRCFQNPKIRGIKLHPLFHHCSPDDPEYEPVYGFADEKGLAVLNHDWGSSKNLEAIASRYPHARFIQAHTGGWWNGRDRDGFLELAKMGENVYLDVAASIAFRGAFEKLVGTVGADKIVYGSDFPYMDMGYQLGRVVLSEISTEEKRKILSLNARKLLRI